MDTTIRLFLYIILINIAYMIYSLCRKGFKEQFGYIWELVAFLTVLILMMKRGWSDGYVLSIGFIGIILIVIIPIIIQRHIEILMAEGLFSDLVFYTKLKSALAWSDLNAHLKDIAVCAEEYSGDVSVLETKIREMLGQGEAYDKLTRVFLGFLHFNNRNFDGLIRDLKIPDKPFSAHSFDELMYLVRAYLETTRYDEAIEAQFALEAQLASGPEEEVNYKYGNCIVNRMIFFSFLGWVKEFNELISEYPDDFFGLPPSLVNFWKGVCLFNGGNFDEGEKLMFSVIKTSSEIDENDPWLPFMRDRLRGLKDNRVFFGDKVLPQLNILYEKYANDLKKTIESAQIENTKIKANNLVTNIIMLVTTVVSFYVMFNKNIGDVSDLLYVGANSSFLVKNGEYFRLFTYQFIHIGYMHLLMNMYAIKYFAPTVETVAGWPLMLSIYIISGITGGLLAAFNGQKLSAGASGAVLGLLGAVIIYEIFKTNNISKIENRTGLATLLFILVANIVFGFYESNIDNWAHLGGFGSGCVMALLSLPLFKFPNFKKIFNIILLCIMFSIGGYSVTNLYNSQANINKIYQNEKFVETSFDKCIFSLEIPDSWELFFDDKVTNRIEALGPFSELLRAVDFSVLKDINLSSTKQLMEEMLEITHKQLTEASNIKIKERIGPEKFKLDSQTSGYKVVWNYINNEHPISRIDYFLGEKNLYLYLRFEFVTTSIGMYDTIIERILKSYKSKDYTSYYRKNNNTVNEK